MTFKVLVVLFCLQFSVSGFAKPVVKKENKRKVSSTWCESRQLKISSKLLSEIKVELDSKPRLQIIQGMWFEILSKKPASQVIPIIQYLAYTEQESSLSGYYQALAVAIGVPDSIEEETEKWPEVSKLTPVKVKVQELCRLYKLAGGQDE